MNNEELIIQMLTNISEKINGIDERTTRIETHLENVTDKNILLLTENYIPNIEETKENTDNINKLLFDVDNLKRVVISHSNDINKLMKVK
ncbi:MAG: hypothetical protein QM644_06660 [Mobilitalea sp.]